MNTEQLKVALLARGADDMWTQRAVMLLEALDGTGVSPSSPSLLADMIAAKEGRPAIEAFLDSLPGVSSGHHDAAQEHLGFLTMQINAVAA